VTVLTVRLPADLGAEKRVSAAAHEVVTVDAGQRYSTRVLRWLRKLRFAGSRAIEPVLVSTGASDPGPSRKAGIRELALALLGLPDADQHFIRAAMSSARRWRKGDFDLIYSTAPPFSGHLAAKRISRRLGARLVLEFRDPWIHPHTRRVVRNFRLTRWVDDRMEDRCIRAADRIIAVTDAAADLIRRRPDSPPVDVVLNGISAELLESQPPHRTGPLNILYAGSLYLYRDPRKFLQAFSLVLQRRGWGTDHVRVELMGKCRFFHGESVEEIATQLGIREYLTFTDHVPHAEAMRRIAAADVLLLLAQRQPLQVPNKLYDYLGMRAPIVAYADSQGETARMLRSVGGHLVIDHANVARQADGLEALLESRLMHREALVGNVEVLQEWTSERQMQQLLRALSL